MAADQAKNLFLLFPGRLLSYPLDQRNPWKALKSLPQISRMTADQALGELQLRRARAAPPKIDPRVSVPDPVAILRSIVPEHPIVNRVSLLSGTDWRQRAVTPIDCACSSHSGVRE